MNLLVINGPGGAQHDYSKYIQRRGLAWARNDLDSEKTVRVKSGRLRRDKITTKRTVKYTMMKMPRKLIQQLDKDLSQSTFRAKYDDLHGVMTRTFYCSSFEATLAEVYDDDEAWEGISFNMIEV